MADTEQQQQQQNKQKRQDDDEEEQGERPKTFQYGYRIPGRTYVQPQWIWDCINAGKIVRADLYAPGALLPPHLSPFVKPKQGEYDPTKSLAEQEREGEVEEFEEAEREARELEEATAGDDGQVDEEEEEEGDEGAEELGSDGGMQVAGSDEDENEEDENENEETNGRNGDGFGGFSDDDYDDDEESVSDEALTAAANQAELEAEAQGLTIDEVKRRKVGKPHQSADVLAKSSSSSSARKRGEKKRAAEEEERQRRMGMMPRKKKKLYEKMQYGLKRDGEAAEKLRSKRRRIEGTS